MKDRTRVAVVIPVLDDWESLIILLNELRSLNQGDCKLTAFIVDDGSRILRSAAEVKHDLSDEIEVVVIQLSCNLGHQRAIAIGLVEIFNRSTDYDLVLIMDGDGEDTPAGALTLLRVASQNVGHVICAQRLRRPSLKFSIWYRLYQVMFRALTGARIDFGNFSVVPIGKLRTLVTMPSLWNNLAATFVRSRLPIVRVPLDRGHRYAGRSRMNFVSLVTHGLGAVAVFADIVMIRMMTGAIILAAFVAVGMLIAVGIRLFTSLAIPGWTTSVVGLLFLALLQAIVIFVLSSIAMLSTRSSKGIVPLYDAKDFVSQYDDGDRHI